MLLSIQVTVDDKTTPKLAELMRALDDKEKRELYSAVADDFEILTREHITKAAKTRHTTAKALGATPTGYLEKRANAVEAAPSTGAINLRLQGDIFKRTFGPVTVTATKANFLTIPWRKESYGRRAGEFADLFVFRSKRGAAFLAQRDGRLMKLLFLLKKSVVLPQDRGLLPSEAEYARAAEKCAVTWADAQLARLA